MRHASKLISLATVLLLAGCTLAAPQYTASLPNVQKLRDAGQAPVRVGAFVPATGDAEASLSLRGSSMHSPYQDSYSAYVGEALKQELSLAGKLAPGAEIEVSGLLNKNTLDASGFSKGFGGIEARFVVKKNNQVRYDAVKSASHEWESSFAGAIAIPRAQLEYANLVQKLLAELYADPAFAAALN
ncbi:hypothetical protein D0B54_00545 [Solimonas sp. K1W22B-7]|uniref:hypothetical protein n=1 Tax=Solimonas sp. K1W22B-7 TaxID=2303331 RepID=UPI000E336DAE|nr:hypothetical protein [Solimonas sp. K1W22B-7]AXQ27267.1 hypothetical protein D0B54_00545 [Solimonas sp. K1W22B-7]